MEMFKKYILSVLVGVDQLVNAILFGSNDHTISGRVGYNSLLGKRWAIYAEVIIDTLFFFDERHCYNSIEWDEVPLSEDDF